MQMQNDMFRGKMDKKERKSAAKKNMYKKRDALRMNKIQNTKKNTLKT